MRGIAMGGAYAFDREAYDRFSPLVTKEGLELPQQDFLGHSTGRHYIRVQLGFSSTGLVPDVQQAPKSAGTIDVPDTHPQELRGHESGMTA